MKTVVALLFVFAMTGCGFGYGTDYHVIVDSTVSARMVEATVQAVEMWKAAVPVTMDVTMSDTCKRADHVICVHEVLPAQIEQVMGDYKWGGTERGPDVDGADVWITAHNIPDDELHVVIAHELGHAQWLNHTGPGTLMDGIPATQSHIITATDIQQWKSLR